MYLDYSAVLWSLVSPRDHTKSPDRFTDKGQSRMGNTGEQGGAYGASFRSPYESLHSREEGDHTAGKAKEGTYPIPRVCIGSSV